MFEDVVMRADLDVRVAIRCKQSMLSLETSDKRVQAIHPFLFSKKHFRAMETKHFMGMAKVAVVVVVVVYSTY